MLWRYNIFFWLQGLRLFIVNRYLFPLASTEKINIIDFDLRTSIHVVVAISAKSVYTVQH